MHEKNFVHFFIICIIMGTDIFYKGEIDYA